MAIDAKPLMDVVGEILDVEYNVDEGEIEAADLLALEGYLTFCIEEKSGADTYWAFEVAGNGIGNRAELMEDLVEFAKGRPEEYVGVYAVTVV